jgi:diacylglycerol kinase (ATP)
LKLLIIFNPNAGYGRSTRRLADIKTRFEELRISAEFLATEFAGHGTELVGDTDLSTYDGLVAAGGDGTVFEVVNGLYRHPACARIPLGLIPIGTGNAFARELNLQADDWHDAIDILHRGHKRRIDVGLVRSADKTFHFLNIVGMGFSVEAGLSAQKIKSIGNAAYTLATLWQVLKLKSYPLQIRIDGEDISSDNVFVTISNSRYTGTHFLIAPDAQIDDGLFDVTILEKLTRRRLLKLFPTVYDGGHVAYDEVTTRKAGRIEITSPGAMLLGPDGEFCGHSPAEISCLHHDIEIFSP